jgi:hypothetical protein
MSGPYAGNQINNENNVDNVTANYLKTRPSTRFSTRQLAFMQIDCTNIQNDWSEPNSLFTKVVRGVQLVAEVYAVGTPNDNALIVVVGADTNAAEAELNNMAVNLTQQFSNGGISATVSNVGLYGAGFLGLGTNNFSEDHQTTNPTRSGLRPPYENESVAQYV